MKTTKTFINAQLLSDGKFYNKIEIKYNTMLQMYFLYADGVYKAESVDADNLRTMVGTELGNKNLFVVRLYANADDDVDRLCIKEVPFTLNADEQTLKLDKDSDGFWVAYTNSVNKEVFTTEHQTKQHLIKMCKDHLKYAIERRDWAQNRVDSLTKCLQYYEGENK